MMMTTETCIDRLNMSKKCIRHNNGIPFTLYMDKMGRISVPLRVRVKAGIEEAAGADVECVVRVLQTYEEHELGKKAKAKKSVKKQNFK